MRKLFSIGFIITILLLPANAVMADEVLTLSKAKELALIYSKDIEKAKLDIDLADKARRDADVEYEKARANYKTAGASSSVDAKRDALEQAENNLKDKRTELEKTKLTVEYKVEDLYLKMLSLEEQLKLVENNLKLLRKQADIKILEKELGMATQLQVEQQIQNALSVEQQLNSLYNLQQTYKWQMNRYIGRPLDNPLKLALVKIDVVSYMMDIDASYNKAQEASLAIKQLNRTIEDKKNDIPYYQETQSDVVESLNLTIKSTEYNLESTEYTLKLTIKNTHDKVDLARKTLMDSSSIYVTAKNDYEMKKIQYELGLISQIALDSSKQSCEQAYYNYLKASYDYYLAQRELQLAEQGIILQ